MQQLLYGSDPLQMKAGAYNNPQAVGELVQVPDRDAIQRTAQGEAQRRLSAGVTGQLFGRNKAGSRRGVSMLIGDSSCE
jgi:hypothetical protein